MTKATLIDGKAFSDGLVERVAIAAADLASRIGRPPALAVVLVGDNAASAVYVRNKIERTTTAGMRSIEHRLGSDAGQAELLAIIEDLNNDDGVDGILVQLPLPDQIDEAAVINAISPDKDVDGFHVVNAGRLATGQDALVPCTTYGCLLLLQDHLGDLSGLNAVVVGRSNIVGMPVAHLLQSMDATVTVCHSRTADLAAHCRRADIVVAAIGKAEMVPGDWIKPGATVIDVGINSKDAPELPKGYRLCGDVDFESVKAVAGAITPVPGGVGPMTIAMLMKNTLNLARHAAGLPRLPLRAPTPAPA